MDKFVEAYSKVIAEEIEATDLETYDDFKWLEENSFVEADRSLSGDDSKFPSLKMRFFTKPFAETDDFCFELRFNVDEDTKYRWYAKFIGDLAEEKNVVIVSFASETAQKAFEKLKIAMQMHVNLISSGLKNL